MLVGENAGSKLEKANRLGVKVVKEDELIEMIGENLDEVELEKPQLKSEVNEENSLAKNSANRQTSLGDY